jgi:hypothetical protein
MILRYKHTLLLLFIPFLLMNSNMANAMTDPLDSLFKLF